MLIRWLLAAAHLLGLGIGLGAVWARGRALARELDRSGIRRVLAADAWWGVAALIWILTGLARAFGGFEKGSAYYLHNHAFLGKMALLAGILILEIRPIVTFTAWRAAIGRGDAPHTGAAASLARTSYVQAVMVVLMVLAATAMARGLGIPSR